MKIWEPATCCCCCNVRTGSIVIAILYMVGGCISVLNEIRILIAGDHIFNDLCKDDDDSARCRNGFWKIESRLWPLSGVIETLRESVRDARGRVSRWSTAPPSTRSIFRLQAPYNGTLGVSHRRQVSTAFSSRLKTSNFHQEELGFKLVQLLLSFFFIAIGGLLLHGILKKKTKFFVPIMIAYVIQISIMILIGVAEIILLMVYEVIMSVTVVFVAIWGLLIFLETYFLLVIRAHYYDVKREKAQIHTALEECDEEALPYPGAQPPPNPANEVPPHPGYDIPLYPNLEKETK